MLRKVFASVSLTPREHGIHTVRVRFRPFAFLFLMALAFGRFALAQSADPAWLRYDALKNAATGTPHLIAVIGRDAVLRSAGEGLVRALGTEPANQGSASSSSLPAKDAFVLGRWRDIRAYFPELKPSQPLSPDGYWLKTVKRREGKYWV